MKWTFYSTAQQYEEIQREWDELLWHCRGLLPPRPVRRLGSEFLGKRSPSDGPSLMNAAVQWCSDEFAQDHWLCTCLFPTSDASEESEPGVEEALESGDAARPTKRGLGAILLSGKRMNAKWINPINRRIMGSEFLGKRASPLGSEFLGKRASRPLGSEFLGKRSVVPPSDGVVME